MGKGGVAGDAIEPGDERFGIADGVDAFDNAGLGLLEDVPGVGLIGDEAANVVKKLLLPGADKFFEGVPITIAAASE
jgi:hypothetical protein